MSKRPNNYNSTRPMRADFVTKVAAVPEADVAWFSGWLCADGSIKYRDKTAGIRFVICDKDPLERFSQLWGNCVSPPQKPSGFGKRPRYEWGIRGFKAKTILMRCLPWLSARYKQRAQLAIATTPDRRQVIKLTIEDVIAIKKQLAKSTKWGVSRDLAQHYHVTDAMIYSIKKGRVWQDIHI